MSKDNIPTIDEFRPVVLRVLQDGQVRHVREICELVADSMRLSEQVREELIPSGQPRYQNRINWACSGLFYAGLITRPRRGYCQITDAGLQVAERNLSIYTDEDMLEWEVWVKYQLEIAQRKTKSGEAEVETEPSSNPIEVMSNAERDFKIPRLSFSRKRLSICYGLWDTVVTTGLNSMLVALVMEVLMGLFARTHWG